MPLGIDGVSIDPGGAAGGQDHIGAAEQVEAAIFPMQTQKTADTSVIFQNFDGQQLVKNGNGKPDCLFFILGPFSIRCLLP